MADKKISELPELLGAGVATSADYLAIVDTDAASTKKILVSELGNALDIAQLSGAEFTGDVTVPSLNGGQLAGMRNKIINGNFQINQRGYVSGTNVGAANTYTLDRWRVVTSGQNITFTASGNGSLVTAPAGGLEQVIEGINIEGGTFVLSWTGTATATVNGTARAKGEAFTLTANTNATVRFSSGTVGLVQLEPGYVATPFEHRPYGAELALCQRYTRPIGAAYSMTGQAYSTTNALLNSYGVPMRATPSFSTSSGFSVMGAAGGNLAVTAINVGAGVDALAINITVAAGLAAGNACMLSVAPAGAVLSAEL